VNNSKKIIAITFLCEPPYKVSKVENDDFSIRGVRRPQLEDSVCKVRKNKIGLPKLPSMLPARLAFEDDDHCSVSIEVDVNSKRQILTSFASGGFHSVFMLDESKTEERKVLKIIRPDKYDKATSDTVKDFFSTGLRCYRTLKLLGFNVAELFNEDRVEIDMRWIFKYYEQAVNPAEQRHRGFGLEVFRKICEHWRQGQLIVPDFSVDNFRFDEFGRLVVIDFTEVDVCEVMHALNFVSCIKSWQFLADELVDLKEMIFGSLESSFSICSENKEAFEFLEGFRKQLVISFSEDFH
jgi:hypothetical protein